MVLSWLGSANALSEHLQDSEQAKSRGRRRAYHEVFRRPITFSHHPIGGLTRTRRQIIPPNLRIHVHRPVRWWGQLACPHRFPDWRRDSQWQRIQDIQPRPTLQQPLDRVLRALLQRCSVRSGKKGVDVGRVSDNFERVLGAEGVGRVDVVEFGDVRDIVPWCSRLFGTVKEGGVNVGAGVLRPRREAVFDLPDV